MVVILLLCHTNCGAIASNLVENFTLLRFRLAYDPGTKAGELSSVMVSIMVLMYLYVFNIRNGL